MQPSLKQIDNSLHVLFQINKVNSQHFYPLWHFHPQCEIIAIEEGSGTLYIGDGIDHFKPGDVIIFGSKIPHLLRNYPEYFKTDSELRVKATVIYFNENFLGDDFLTFDETLPIKNLLKTSKRGMIISGESKTRIKDQLHITIEKKGFDRLQEFISLLNYTATKADFNILSSAGFSLSFDEKEVARLNKISDFLMKNFTRTIRLDEISEVANMSKTAFCRYFKEKTNKTMITFLNEIRVGYACKLLIEKQHLNVSQICYRTGFNNITNFNIQFKIIKNCSPLKYRSLYFMDKGKKIYSKK